MDYLNIEQSSTHPLVIECQHALIAAIWEKAGLPTKGRLLDIGPGKGLYTRYFLDHGFQVDCVDIDASMRQIYVDLGCGFKVADLRKDAIPYEDQSYDVIWCSHVIEHLPDVYRFSCDLFRLLKPGGYAVVRTPDVSRIGWDFWHDPTHLQPFIKVALEKILRMVGFESVLSSNCDIPEIRGLHRIRLYRWFPPILFMGSNLIGVGRRPA